MVLRDNSISGGGGGGATWAFEVGGQSMVCPIIVEDLGPPGQMLIEVCNVNNEKGKKKKKIFLQACIHL